MIQVGAQCPGCQRMLGTGLRGWHRVCACGYEGSTLAVDIDVDGVQEIVDEVRREEGLGPLRQRNFRVLVEDLARRVEAQDAGRLPRLLDVGCAHGWFLEAAQSHFQVSGIEPDARIATVAKEKGFQVRKGFFPDVLNADERFDVIVFNDVLEHIPDIGAALRACARHLERDGWVVVNAPARSGALYRTSKVLARIGLPGSFDRMWQKGFPSPHVHYLDDASMSAIAARTGLRISALRSLPSMSVRGLYSRIRTDRQVSIAKAAGIAAVLTAAGPVLTLLPADIKVWFLQAAHP